MVACSVSLLPYIVSSWFMRVSVKKEHFWASLLPQGRVWTEGSRPNILYLQTVMYCDSKTEHVSCERSLKVQRYAIGFVCVCEGASHWRAYGCCRNDNLGIYINILCHFPGNQFLVNWYFLVSWKSKKLFFFNFLWIQKVYFFDFVELYKTTFSISWDAESYFFQFHYIQKMKEFIFLFLVKYKK